MVLDNMKENAAPGPNGFSVGVFEKVLEFNKRKHHGDVL